MSTIQTIRIEREWAMPNHRTFQMPPVKKLIQEENPGGIIAEPFPFESNIDCFEYLSQFKDESVDFVLLDPPYTKRQVSEHYAKNGIKASSWQTSSGWTAKIKRECARILKVGGKSITFGYNTNGLGKVNGMKITRILICPSGGDHYDLLCTVETKVQGRLIPITELMSCD